jgi:hypothetical protein
MNENKKKIIQEYENQDYNIPDVEEIFIDTHSNKPIDEKLTSAYKPPIESPFDRIKRSAHMYKLEILDPKHNCKRCGGRGYLGMRVDSITHETTDMPVPCPCIYPKVKNEEERQLRESADSLQSLKHMNRKKRRATQKQLRKNGK